MLAQLELLAPLLAALPSPHVALPLTVRPLSLSLLRHARKRARPRHGWLELCGVHAHHMQGSNKALKRADNPKNRLSWKGS
jgi:hypothetical protein